VPGSRDRSLCSYPLIQLNSTECVPVCRRSVELLVFADHHVYKCLGGISESVSGGSVLPKFSLQQAPCPQAALHRGLLYRQRFLGEVSSSRLSVVSLEAMRRSIPAVQTPTLAPSGSHRPSSQPNCHLRCIDQRCLQTVAAGALNLCS